MSILRDLTPNGLAAILQRTHLDDASKSELRWGLNPDGPPHALGSLRPDHATESTVVIDEAYEASLLAAAARAADAGDHHAAVTAYMDLLELGPERHAAYQPKLFESLQVALLAPHIHWRTRANPLELCLLLSGGLSDGRWQPVDTQPHRLVYRSDEHRRIHWSS